MCIRDRIRSFILLRKYAVPGAGWMLAGGILNLLLTAVILINPLFGWFGISVIWGIYLTAVSYTHLDVYKRQTINSRQVIFPVHADMKAI